MIQAVLFDLDGTLLDRDASVAAFIDDQYDRMQQSLGHIPKALYIERFIELDKRGYVWKDQVYGQLIQDFKIGLKMETLLDDYLAHFQLHCVSFKGLHPMLHELKKQGVKLGIISNGKGDFQLGNINALGIENYFDVILISESERVRKPDPRIFQRALGRLAVQAQESVFVGDHPANDVAAAQNVGMYGVWKPSSLLDEAPSADAQIDSLEELKNVIAALNA